jgi:hypothetical protein
VERIKKVYETFPAGPPLTEAQQVGRTDAITQLESRLRAGEVVLLFEGRRIGKTSLAGAALDRIANARGQVAAATLTRFPVPAHATEFLARQLRSPANQAGRSIASIIEWLQRRHAADPLGAEATAELGFAADLAQPLTSAERDLPALLAGVGRSDRTVAILLDEAHALAEWPSNIQQSLNAVLRENRDVGVVIASSERRALERLTARGGPLHLAGSRFHLEDITGDKWIPALKGRFEQLSTTLSYEDAETIVHETAGQPYLTMRLARDSARLAASQFAVPSHVESALIMQALYELKRDPVWEELR